MYTDSTPVQDSFVSDLSKAPYCTDNPRHGVYRAPRPIALEHRGIQYNRKSAHSWLNIDIDRPMAAFAWEDAKLVVPNVVAVNPDNGHAHPGWKLLKPVHCHDTANPKPLRYFAAIERGFRRRLGGDPNYTGLIAKNPLHPHWRTMWLAPYPYSLQELAECLDQADMRSAATPREEAGLGRHTALFDHVRHIAYREVAIARRASSREAFFGHLLTIALEFNTGFMPPLTFGDVRATVRSIAKWSWANVGFGARSNSKQVNRGLKSGRVRRAAAQERQAALAGLLSDTGSLDRLRSIVDSATGMARSTVYADLAALRGGPAPTAAVEKPVTIFGGSMSMTAAAAGAGVSKATFSRRIASGVDPNIAAILPARDGGRTHCLARLGSPNLIAECRAALDAAFAALPHGTTVADLLA